MFKQISKLVAVALLVLTLNACNKDKPKTDPTAGLDKLLIGTNISTSNPVIGYVGTLKDLSVTNFTNAKSRQTTTYPYVTINKNDVFVLQHLYGDIIKKYTRQPDGTLAETGSLTTPAASAPTHIVIENDTKGYISLYRTGRILVFNPSRMDTTGSIDLRSYALGGDGSPDPSVMAFKDGKLYVGCCQTSNGFTSSHPAQVLIIDTRNNNAITSTTDDRTFWAGSINEAKSMFFDESGDLYVYCVASYGFGGPTQKCGFLRIKSGRNSFDSSYFFNTADYNIADIPGNKINYLQRMRYYKNGIVYSTGNIPALTSNPPNYVNDRSFGSFKVDIINKTITKLNIPNSNGYAASVGIFNNKILFGIAGTSAVGFYSYDPATNTASTNPVVTTQGDPVHLESF